VLEVLVDVSETSRKTCGASRVPCCAMISDEPITFSDSMSSRTKRYSRLNGSRMRASNERTE
jgi:hypothetical protein